MSLFLIALLGAVPEKLVVVFEADMDQHVILDKFVLSFSFRVLSESSSDLIDVSFDADLGFYCLEVMHQGQVVFE
jgi:hypothetical protein